MVLGWKLNMHFEKQAKLDFYQTSQIVIYVMLAVRNKICI